MSWLVILLLLCLLFARLPLFISIIALASLGFHQADLDFSIVTLEIYRLAEIPVLIALPLFTFAGYLLSESNTSDRLVRVSRALFGWMPAGLALITIVVCSFFTAFTGASGATIVALGALLLPALKEEGFNDKFSLGLVTCSGSMGLLIPPALPLILFGVVAQQLELEQTFTLQQLLVAGLVPALITVVLLFGWSLLAGGLKTKRHPFSWHEASSALWAARWEIPLPFVVLGGLYGGYMTLSEIAIITVLYLLIVELVLYKDIPFNKISNVAVSSIRMSGGILIVLAASLVLANWMIDQEIPSLIFTQAKLYIDSPVTFLFVLNILLLILGALLDIFSAIVIMVPLLLPVAAGFGVHPVHLAVIFLTNMQIGYLTPPIGMNLFIASYRFNLPVAEIFKAVLPFILVLLLALILITWVPSISLMWI